MANAQLDRIYTGLVHIHYALSYFYKNLDVGNAQQRQQTRTRLSQSVQELGRLINSLKPLIAQGSNNAMVKKATDARLAELVNGVNERLSEVANWAIMMKADKRDKESMIVRVQHLRREFVALQDYLKVPYTSAASLEEMVKFADYLDEIGAYALADTVTEGLFLLKQAYIPKMRKEEKKESPIQPPHEGTLSTRYCPDHRGVQTIRIAERTYQCPIDGKVYNYDNGYVNYQGQKVPGGSVAAQTPTSADYGGIPMRIYDSRQSILNRIN